MIRSTSVCNLGSSHPFHASHVPPELGYRHIGTPGFYQSTGDPNPSPHNYIAMLYPLSGLRRPLFSWDVSREDIFYSLLWLSPYRNILNMSENTSIQRIWTVHECQPFTGSYFLILYFKQQQVCVLFLLSIEYKVCKIQHCNKGRCGRSGKLEFTWVRHTM